MVFYDQKTYLHHFVESLKVMVEKKEKLLSAKSNLQY